MGGVRMPERAYLEKGSMMKVVRANVIAGVVALYGMALFVGCGKDSRDAGPVAEERTKNDLSGNVYSRSGTIGKLVMKFVTVLDQGGKK